MFGRRKFYVGASSLCGIGAASRFIGVAGAVEPPPAIDADLVVYGATPGGIAAAVVARRMGVKSVAIIGGWRENRLGGMMTGGLGATDYNNPAAIGGFGAELLTKIQLLDGGKPGPPYFFQPKTARAVFDAYVRQYGIATYWGLGGISSCAKNGARITQIRTMLGHVITGRVFIDASYEGDLIAFAGVPYAVGREANSRYGEQNNGVNTRNGGYAMHVDPHIKTGDPASGLLPRVTQNPGMQGAASPLTQAYNFRLTFTGAGPNRRPFPKAPPASYHPLDYEICGRVLAALNAAGLQPGLRHICQFTPLPGNKLDINNMGSWGTDYVGGNTGYVDAGFNLANHPQIDYGLREKIYQNHLDYTMGFFWWLRKSGDPRIPPGILELVNSLWLAEDEVPDPIGADPAGFPAQLYVREARRMISDYVMTEADSMRPNHVRCPYSDVIGAVSYYSDCHDVVNYVGPAGNLAAEGDFYFLTGGQTHAVLFPYRCMRPRQSDCDNLLVTWCISASHVGFGNFRVELGGLVMGHAGGIAASLALAGPAQIAVQQVSLQSLQAALADQQAVIALPELSLLQQFKNTRLGRGLAAAEHAI